MFQDEMLNQSRKGLAYNMNKYLKIFLTRGMAFSGLGPIVAGIVYLILSNTIENFSLTGYEVFLAIVSTYILAFVQAGSNVFHEIEHWSLPKSTLCQLSLIYVVYLVGYLINSWIPFNLTFIILFTLLFVAIYFVIWLTVFITIRATTKSFNEKLASMSD